MSHGPSKEIQMKRLLVLGALVVVGCGAEKSVQPPAESAGVVTLATFIGEVDAQRGIFTIQSEPTPAGQLAGLGSNALRIVPGPTTIGIANDSTCAEPDPVTGCTWNSADRSAATGSGACGATPVTGGYVKLTQNAAYPPTFYGAVYAEITSVSAPATATACNSTAAPTGRSAQYGLWSYGSFVNGTVSSQEWDFDSANHANFTFSGKIYGVVGSQATGIYSGTNLADNGATVAFGLGGGSTMMYMTSAFGYGGSYIPMSTGCVLNSVAADQVNGRIWYVSTPSSLGDINYVGYTLANTTGGNNTTEVTTGAAWRSIIVDPHVAARAWFLQGSVSPSSLRSVSGTTVTLTGETKLTLPAGTATSVAIDSATTSKKIYVTSTSGTLGYLVRVDSANPTAATSITLPVACRRPGPIINSADNTFYFGTISGKVCKLTNAGGTDVVTSFGDTGSTSPVTGIAIEPGTGYVWVAQSADGTVTRIVEGNAANYIVAIPQGLTSHLTTSSSLIWVESTGVGISYINPAP
jgi:hypothetical protein